MLNYDIILLPIKVRGLMGCHPCYGFVSQEELLSCVVPMNDPIFAGDPILSILDNATLRQYLCQSDPALSFRATQPHHVARYQVSDILDSMGYEEVSIVTRRTIDLGTHWLVKGTGARNAWVTCQCSDVEPKLLTAALGRDDGMLRPVMGRRIRNTLSASLRSRFKIVEEVLCPMPEYEEAEPLRYRFCVLSPRTDMLDTETTISTVNALRREEQQELAERICAFIQETGFVDSNFENFRLNAQGEVVIFDTEPFGALYLDETTRDVHLTPEQRVEIGLRSFKNKCGSMFKEAERAATRVLVERGCLVDPIPA